MARSSRRPAPRAIAHVEHLEDAGQDRDVREPGRERRKTPERPVEHLLVAERGQVSGVFGHRLRHELIPEKPIMTPWTPGKCPISCRRPCRNRTFIAQRSTR